MQALTNLIMLCTVVIVGLVEEVVAGKIKSFTEKGETLINREGVLCNK